TPTVPETGCVAGKFETDTAPLTGCVAGKFETATVPPTTTEAGAMLDAGTKVKRAALGGAGARRRATARDPSAPTPASRKRSGPGSRRCGLRRWRDPSSGSGAAQGRRACGYPQPWISAHTMQAAITAK